MKETDMGFETCRMTCEAAKRYALEGDPETTELKIPSVFNLADVVKGMAEDNVTSKLFPPTDTIHLGQGVTATFADHGKAPPKSRGEEIAEKLEGDWIEEIPVSVIADAIDKAIAEERQCWLRALEAYIPEDHEGNRELPYGGMSYPEWVEVMIRGRFTNMESFHESRVKRMVEAERDRILVLAREQLGLHNGEQWQDVHQHIVRAAGAR